MMKKNKFLTVTLLIVWVPVAVRVVWVLISPLIRALSGLLMDEAITYDTLYHIIDPSVNSPTYIKIAICTTLVLIALERLRRTIEQSTSTAEKTTDK